MLKRIPNIRSGALISAAIAGVSAVCIGGALFFAPASTEAKRRGEIAELTTRHGVIKIRFFERVAPRHVASFKKLARKGFYDGTTFHRVIPGFMIQGGDPFSKDALNRHRHGTGGPGYRLRAEFSNIRHTRGIVSAARSAHPDSAGSQFYIMVAPAPHLNGQYTVFGKVIKGMDVVDKIVNEPKDGRNNPFKRVEMTVKIKRR